MVPKETGQLQMGNLSHSCPIDPSGPTLLQTDEKRKLENLLSLSDENTNAFMP